MIKVTANESGSNVTVEGRGEDTWRLHNAASSMYALPGREALAHFLKEGKASAVFRWEKANPRTAVTYRGKGGVRRLSVDLMTGDSMEGVLGLVWVDNVDSPGGELSGWIRGNAEVVAERLRQLGPDEPVRFYLEGVRSDMKAAGVVEELVLIDRRRRMA